MYLEKPIRNPEIKIVLQIGVAQIIYMRTPNYAAVNQTVEIIRPKLKTFKPLVNAILRKVINNQQDYIHIINSTDHMLPAWILNKWKRNYGNETTELIIKSILSDPYLDISIDFSQTKIFKKFNAKLLPNGSIRLRKHNKISSLPMYKEGNWWVQMQRQQYLQIFC